MSEATTTTSNDKKSRTTSIAKLTEKKKALEEELKATQEKLEEKQKAKATKEKEKAKKDRTRALILTGLYYIENFMNIIKNENVTFTQAKEITNMLCREIAEFYRDKNKELKSLPKNPKKTDKENAEILEKKQKKLENEMNIILNLIRTPAQEIIKSKAIQAARQSADQSLQE